MSRNPNRIEHLLPPHAGGYYSEIAHGAIPRYETTMLPVIDPRFSGVMGAGWADDIKKIASGGGVIFHVELPEGSIRQIAELQGKVERLESVVFTLTGILQSLTGGSKGLPAQLLEERFDALVAEWKSTRGHTSVDFRLAMHPAYQSIMAMGPPAIPLLLREMDLRPSHWTWALRHITGTDPVPKESRGKLKEMAKAWTQWGRDNGYEW